MLFHCSLNTYDLSINQIKMLLYLIADICGRYRCITLAVVAAATVLFRGFTVTTPLVMYWFYVKINVVVTINMYTGYDDKFQQV